MWSGCCCKHSTHRAAAFNATTTTVGRYVCRYSNVVGVVGVPGTGRLLAGELKIRRPAGCARSVAHWLQSVPRNIPIVYRPLLQLYRRPRAHGEMCSFASTEILMMFDVKIFINHTRQIENKKFDLMRMRREKAYSSCCSQTVSLSPAISTRLLRMYRYLMPS